MNVARRLAVTLALPLALASCGSTPVPSERRPASPPAAAIVLPRNGWTAGERARHVLSRFAFGPSPADLAAVERGGIERWLEEQMRPASLRDDAVEERLRRYPTLSLSIARLAEEYPRPAAREKMRELVDPERLPRRIGEELVGQKLVRAVESRRQLQEVLVDFWFNHFNVFIDKGADRWLLTSYERDAIRPHVFGKFRDLLEATATHPAMLFYLDNWLSTKEGFARGGRKVGLNENYARELLELHTLGVDGGYTQHDVREVARCFTGWSFVNPNAPKAARRGGEAGAFLFRPFAHDDGKKVVLGHTIAAGGRGDGEAVLDVLARHPSTARFIARKLCAKFVAENPPAGLVERVARTWEETDGDLSAVYRAILTSKELWSDEARGSLTKTPFELAVSAVRALGGRVDRPDELARRVAQMGEPLYRCAAPTGYKGTAEAWMSTGGLLSRFNFALALASGRVDGVAAPLDRVADPAVSDPGKATADLARALLGGAPSAATLDGIRTSVAKDPRAESDAERRIERAKIAGLILGSPEFQRQ